MKKTIIALSILLFSTSSGATGIPVFDLANVMQAVTAVQQLKSQLEEQKRLYQAMNGNRGMGKLLNNPELRNYLPQDWQKMYDQIAKGNMDGLTGSALEIRKANQLFDCNKLTGTKKTMCERQGSVAAANKAFGLQAYEKSEQRIEQIEALMSKINETSDAKAIAELNARLQAENALIQNEQIKLQIFSELARAEDRLIEQQAREKAIADSHRTRGTTFNLKNYNSQ